MDRRPKDKWFFKDNVNLLNIISNGSCYFIQNSYLTEKCMFGKCQGSVDGDWNYKRTSMQTLSKHYHICCMLTIVPNELI